ncbi:hypothetical protein [Shewanella goraebulensis]|uniref:hypothetical protein n=1 Tax=Shewanella goraebulensis TaxID=3050637 RepID=UPI00254EAE4D|nr:hypothetical protein [Shewanella goraebulensis]
MQSTIYSAIQPLSSYNPFSLNKSAATQAIKQNSSATKVDGLNDISAINKQAKVNETVNSQLGGQHESHADLNSIFDQQVLYFDESAIKSAVDAKVQYDNQTSTNAQQHHSQGSAGAIKEYLLNQHAVQREQIQQMVGIDLYA